VNNLRSQDFIVTVIRRREAFDAKATGRYAWAGAQRPMLRFAFVTSLNPYQGIKYIPALKVAQMPNSRSRQCKMSLLKEGP
jgi:hypothetical protein